MPENVGTKMIRARVLLDSTDQVTSRRFPVALSNPNEGIHLHSRRTLRASRCRRAKGLGCSARSSSLIRSLKTLMSTNKRVYVCRAIWEDCNHDAGNHVLDQFVRSCMLRGLLVVIFGIGCCPISIRVRPQACQWHKTPSQGPIGGAHAGLAIAAESPEVNADDDPSILNVLDQGNRG